MRHLLTDRSAAAKGTGDSGVLARRAAWSLVEEAEGEKAHAVFLANPQSAVRVAQALVPAASSVQTGQMGDISIRAHG